MQKVKNAQIVFYFVALLLFAKPFWGFAVFSRVHPPHESNILIKVFSKRKLEYNEGSENDISAVQKKLANPDTYSFLRFSFFLAVLFPAFFSKNNALTNGFISRLQLSLIPVRQTYLLTGKLLI
jgi:hypothetical protein